MASKTVVQEFPSTQRKLVKINETIPNNSFSLVTYNTLAESIFLTSSGYEYCHEEFKKRTHEQAHRHKLLLKEVRSTFRRRSFAASNLWVEFCERSTSGCV